MIGLYLAALLFGAVLVGASLLGFGDKDADAGHDADAGEAGHVDHGGGLKDFTWLPILSLRFWTFGALAFGLTGALLWLLPLAAWVTGLLASAVGLLVGLGASAMFRRIRRDEVSGETSLARFAGEEARVVVVIRPGARGRVAIDSLAGRVELPAVTRDGGTIEHGERVLIAAITDGVADVSRARPREPQRVAQTS